MEERRTRGQRERHQEIAESNTPQAEGVDGVVETPTDHQAEWSNLTVEFDRRLNEAITVLASGEKEKASPLSIYLSNIVDVLKNWLSAHAQVFTQTERTLQGTYMQYIPGVVSTLKPLLAKLKSKGQTAEVYFTVLDYQSYADLVESHEAPVISPRAQGGSSSAGSRQSDNGYDMQMIPPRRNNGISRRRRHRGNNRGRENSLFSEDSGDYRTRRNEERNYESLEIKREMRLYSQLPPPWNKEPSQSVRLERLDVSRLVQTAGDYTFSGRIEDYIRWRDFYIGTIGDVRCAARHKVNALRKALDNVVEIMIDYATGDFEGYRQIVQTLEKSFGGHFRQSKRYDEYFDRGEKIRFNNLMEFREYCKMATGYKALLSQSGKIDLFEADHIYRRLLLPLPGGHIRELQTWLHSSGRFESASNLLRWTEDRLDRMLIEEDVDVRKNKTRGQQYNTKNTTTHRAIALQEVEESSDTEIQDGQTSDDELVAEELVINYAKIKPLNICLLGCDAKHELFRCDRFVLLTPKNRRALMRMWKLMICYSCLKGGHLSKNCREKVNCSVCSAPTHHTLLHLDEKVSQYQLNTLDDTLNNSEVILPFVQIKVLRPNRDSLITFAMLDSGANVSVLDTNIAQEMFPKSKFKQINVSTAAGKVKREVATNYLCITSIHQKEEYTIKVMFFKNHNPLFTLKPPNINNILSKHEYLKEVQSVKKGNQKVSLLLGNDNAFLISPLQIVRGTSMNTPIAERCALGWSIRGPVSMKLTESGIHNVECPSFVEKEDERELLRKIEDSWELSDSLGKTYLTDNEKIAKDILKSTMKLVNNYVQSGILWKGGQPPIVPDNKAMALKRLQALHKHLLKKPVVKNLYHKNIADWIAEGSLVLAERAETGRIHYLSHFPVVNLAKSTTKVRTVVDAAARYKGYALNDYILAGPNIANDVRRVILRFRKNLVAVMGDIQSMFTRIKLLPNERGYHRLLWSESLESEVKTYQFTCFTFGNACSPAVAMSAARYLADIAPEACSRAKEMIYKSTIVDDSLDSVSSVEEAITLIKNLREIYSKGSMVLRKLASSHLSVLEEFPEKEILQEVKLCFQNNISSTEASIKALGVSWLPMTDVITFNIQLDKQLLSRRQMLSALAKIYDPSSLISPLLVGQKILIQKSWSLKLNWDTSLPTMICKEWERLAESVRGETQFPRALIQQGEIENQIICTFSDASEDAYGAVSYLLTKYKGNETTSRIICAKSKVAPLKQVSIPRLELQAAVEAAEMTMQILEALDMSPANAYFYTDSMDVIYWLRSASRQLKVFVSNRVGLIQRSTWVDNWRWTPTDLNPADLLTRPNTYKEFQDSIWFQGPNYLVKPEDTPSQPEIKKSYQTQKEIKTKNNVFSIFHIHQCQEWHSRLKKFSSWTRFVRAITRLKRRTASISQNNPLMAEELKDVECFLIARLQAEVWPEEYKKLKDKKTLPKTHAMFKYSPFYNIEWGTLHASGRISHAQHLPYLTRFPFLIPDKCHWSVLLIRDVHQNDLKHMGGLRQLMAAISSKYMIPKLRAQVKAILRSCVLCRRQKFITRIPAWAPLPSHRLPQEELSPPFQCSAMDFFGPLFVDTTETTLEEPRAGNRGRPPNKIKEISRRKVYVLIITCTLYRAVHIELTDSLSADSLLMAIDRFLSVRNRPKKIISDNAKNFIGTSNLLNETFKTLQPRLLINYPNIIWEFTTPLDPHKNGVVERMVGLCKNYLSKLTLNKKLSYEQLNTALKMVEGALNQRPLQEPEVDSNEEEPLTPNHFLKGSTYNTLLPNLDDVNLAEGWSKSNELVKAFWNRFLKQLVPEMNILAKKISQTIDYKPEQIVLVQEELNNNVINFPAYPLAKVVEVYRSKDGVVRSVRLLFQGKHIIRGVSKIAPLLK